MNISGIGASTQTIWEELRQETMHNGQKSVSASNGQEVSLISIDPDDLDGDGVVTHMERAKAQRKHTAQAGSSPRTNSGTVATSLENIGPNTYERIRTNAGNAYLAQSASFADTGGAASGLCKRA